MFHIAVPGWRGSLQASPNAAGLKLLNLGCGTRRHPAWTNVDLTPTGPDVLHVDLRKRLPFPSHEFDAVYASHVLEHLTPPEAKRVLSEVRRIVRAGGVVRIVVPDLEGIARDYLAAVDAVDNGVADARWWHRWMTVELLDQLVRTASGGAMARWWSCNPIPARDFIHSRLGAEAAAAIKAIHDKQAAKGTRPVEPSEILDTPPANDWRVARFSRKGERHKWMYDRLSMAELMLASGFIDPRRVPAIDSRIPNFREYGLDADGEGTVHKPDSLFMEAIVPTVAT